VFTYVLRQENRKGSLAVSKLQLHDAVNKATVNKFHVSGHPPARNFNGRINWSLLVTFVIIGHVI